jgi:hypothetical protein
MGSDPDAGHEEPLQLALTVLRVLEELGVEAWIGGSLASSIFGIPRATQDADIIANLSLEMARPLVELLGSEFYADEERIASGIDRRSSFNVIHLPTMFKVDIFLVGRDAWSESAVQRRRSVEVDDQGTHVLVTSPEDIVLHKLVWYREGGHVSDRQWRDALGVLQVQGKRLDRTYLNEMAEELGVADLLEELLQEGASWPESSGSV